MRRLNIRFEIHFARASRQASSMLMAQACRACLCPHLLEKGGNRDGIELAVAKKIEVFGIAVAQVMLGKRRAAAEVKRIRQQFLSSDGAEQASLIFGAAPKSFNEQRQEGALARIDVDFAPVPPQQFFGDFAFADAPIDSLLEAPDRVGAWIFLQLSRVH